MKRLKFLCALSIVFAIEAFFTIMCIVCTQVSFQLMTETSPIQALPMAAITVLMFGVWICWTVLAVNILWDIAVAVNKKIGEWVESNQVDDCPYHLDTRTAYDRDKAIRDYRQDFVDFSDEAHEELANMLAKDDWKVARGPDVKKRLPKGALRQGGKCWLDIEKALYVLQDDRWITASDVVTVAGDGDYTAAQVNNVLGRMVKLNYVTSSALTVISCGTRRAKKYCIVGSSNSFYEITHDCRRS